MELAAEGRAQHNIYTLKQIIQLTAARLPDLMALKDSACWNQTEADWLRLIKLAPELCLGIEVEGRIVSTATAIDYGGDLAWIGMVLTHPARRGQGFARALLVEVMGRLRDLGVRAVKLDATDMGRPLYAQLGFQFERIVERWTREGVPATSAPAPYHIDFAADREAYGADRTNLLNQLESEGYSCGRPGSNAYCFGPCLAGAADEAREHLPSGAAVWDLLPENVAAAGLALESGFRPARRLHRMYYGAETSIDTGRIFACAGFEYG